MVSQTDEQALEAAIQKHLTGTCLEEIGHQSSELDTNYGASRYHLGLAKDFDAQYALDTRFFWEFLTATQKDELDKIKKLNPDDWQRKILQRFDRQIKRQGVRHLLRSGLDVDGAHLQLMYPLPLNSSGDAVKKNFHKNRFSCTRQVRYSLSKPGEEIDMVLFVNGIPVVTLELKNPWTGQTAKYHGKKQYSEDRDHRQPLLSFARCVVHMTADTDEVYMTTKLAGKDTYFLPFNKGRGEGKDAGAGNPVNEFGHKTDYLWKEVFSTHSMANLIRHFVRLDGDSKTPFEKRNLFFPRYHQLQVVRKIVNHVAAHGVGQKYLIQHSAGSGKSNSITWAAFQLIDTYPKGPDVQGTKDMETPLFDSVIVVTDRKLLDRQLRDNIRQFSEVKNIIAAAKKSSELKDALHNGKKIILTTIQKFKYILDGIDDLSDKQFAVIIDEAHSSQSGDTHDNMNRAMGMDEDPDAEDSQDKINRDMKARKMSHNASYFAFTATPKNITLEKFGTEQSDGSFKPFDNYSMKQAIEEKFILDVLANYSTYKGYYELQKSIADNPEFDSEKAQKKLRTYVERSQQTIDIKADIMLEHFIEQVLNKKKLKGKARAMVVTQSIESAIRYHKAINRHLERLGSPFKALIAFSGKKVVDGIEYTEAGINGFADANTKDMFDKNYTGDKKPAGVLEDENRILVVANKYLTGFDQPKLCAMYVDKKLTEVLCVQTLSRLNRAAHKYNKRTEDLFVLDFFNDIEDIQKAFNKFYTSTSLAQATDVNVLHDLRDDLGDVGVYEWQEVEEFSTLFWQSVPPEQLAPIIDKAVYRFEHELELDHEQKVEFKVKAKQFVKIYGQTASILPYEMITWEKLYWYLKHLVGKLKVNDPDADGLDELLESVDLTSYGLQRVKLNHSIKLDDEETELSPQNPNPRGGHHEAEKDPLDDIVRNFNERWFQGWDDVDEKFRVVFTNTFDQIQKNDDLQLKYTDNPDPYTRDLAFEKIMDEMMVKMRKVDTEIYKLYARDPAFRTFWIEGMKQKVDRQQGL